MPVGDLPGWKQIFAEDFTTPCPLGSFLTTYASKWSAYPEGWSDTSKNGVYTPNRTLSVVNGSLQIYLHTDSTSHCVSAPLPRLYGPGTGAFKGLLYGRYSVRFKSDPFLGIRPLGYSGPIVIFGPQTERLTFPREISIRLSPATPTMPMLREATTPSRLRRPMSIGTWLRLSGCPYVFIFKLRVS
jgi:hypothetical protein